MKLEVVFNKLVEVYKVAKTLKLQDNEIEKFQIKKMDFIKKKLVDVCFQLKLAKRRDGNGEYFIHMTRLDDFKEMNLQGLLNELADINRDAKLVALFAEKAGQLPVCEISEDKTQLVEVNFDLELVRVQGQRTFFAEFTEVSKSGLTIVK